MPSLVSVSHLGTNNNLPGNINAKGDAKLLKDRGFIAKTRTHTIAELKIYRSSNVKTARKCQPSSVERMGPSEALLLLMPAILHVFSFTETIKFSTD